MLAAQVIGASADPASHTLFLNRGDRDHVRRNQAVITPDGIVGKIVEVFRSQPRRCLLINDKDSGAGALLADTRTHGVVKGSGDPDPRLDYVVNDEQVHAGEIDSYFRRRPHFPEGSPDRHSLHGEPGKSVSSDSCSARRASGPAGRRADPAHAAGTEEAR